MNAPTKPEPVRVTLGNEVRTLKLSAAAVSLARLKHGRDDLTLGAIAKAGDGLVPLLFWLGLLADHPDTTEEEAALLLAQHGVEEEIAEPLLRYYLHTTRALGRAMGTVMEEYGLTPDERAEPVEDVPLSPAA